MEMAEWVFHFFNNAHYERPVYESNKIDMKYVKTRNEFILEKSEVLASEEDLAIIRPYYEVAKKALKTKKIAAIMDSPIVKPKGYDGDVYFIIGHTNGTFDMVQLDPDAKKVHIDRDTENSPDGGLAIEPSDLAEILGVQMSESDISESMMSEIDLIGQESETREQFVNDVADFLKKHAHNKEAATNKASIEKLADTYFNEDGSKKEMEANESTVNEAVIKRNYKDYVSRKKAEYGDKFDESDLDPRFIPFYESGERIKIDDFGRTIGGTVGITTGWKPVFLLMRTSRSTGSSDILGKHTKIVK